MTNNERLTSVSTLRSAPLLLLAAVNVWFLAAASAPPVLGAQGLPPGPEKDTFVRVCSTCHAAENVIGEKRSRQDWMTVVDLMAERGAEGTPAEMSQIVDYLTAHFGVTAERSKVNVNTLGAKDLTDGLNLTVAEGEAIVEHRTKKGKFASIDDLKKVEGVDAAKIETAKDRITF
jgi:competence protein ComEA